MPLKSKNLYYEKFKGMVENKKGKMISSIKEYQNSHHKLEVECYDGHRFGVSLNNVKNKWCPFCSTRRNERYTKEVAQTLLDKKFIKVRPTWLLNSKGNVMEIDIYNDELKLAIEYNGKQHYEFCQFFHKTIDSFHKRLTDDKLKVQLCKTNNVDLIVVPYTENPYEFLINEFTKRGFKLVNLDKDILIKNELVEKLEYKINENDGQLISNKTKILNRFDSIEIKCNKNHIWTTKVCKILQGSWCHTCGKEVDEDTKDKISNKMKEYFQTEEGKINKQLSHQKRSETMLQRNIEEFSQIKTKLCTGKNGCEQVKSVEFFHKRGAYSYNTYCKDCMSKYKQTRKLI